MKYFIYDFYSFCVGYIIYIKIYQKDNFGWRFVNAIENIVELCRIVTFQPSHA